MATSLRGVSHVLDTVGDGSGDTNATGDYSVDPQEFYYRPEVGSDVEVRRLIILVGGTAGIRMERYCGLSSPLANGVIINARDNAGDIFFITDPFEPVKDTATWGLYAGNLSIYDPSPGDKYVLAELDFTKMIRTGLALKGGDGEFFAVTLSDDFTGLTVQKFMLMGYRTDSGAGY